MANNRPPRVARGVVWAASALTVALSGLIGRVERFREGYQDEIVYRRLARNLLDHGFYGYAPGQRLAYRAPGFPFFDAGIRFLNDSQAAVRVAQAILAGITVLLAAWIARRLFGELAAAVAAVLLLVVGTLAVYASYELSETLATATLVAAAAAAIAAVDRRSLVFAAASGLLLGVSSLARPQTLILVLVVPAVVALAASGDRGRRALLAAVIAAAAVATLAPWTVRNALRLHAFVPVSTYGGVNLYIANNPKADGRFRSADAWVTPEEYARITALPEAEQDREWYRLAFDFIRAQPGTALHNWVRDGILFVRRADPLVRRDYVIRGWWRPPLLDDRILWIGGAAGIVLAAIRPGRARSLLPAVIVAYFIGFFMVFVPLARFRHGVVPFLAVYSGGAVAMIASRIRRRPERPGEEPSAAMAAAP